MKCKMMLLDRTMHRVVFFQQLRLQTVNDGKLYFDNSLLLSVWFIHHIFVQLFRDNTGIYNFVLKLSPSGRPKPSFHGYLLMYKP